MIAGTRPAYAEVRSIRQVQRRHLLPDLPADTKSRQLYYQIMLGPLQSFTQPIRTRREFRKSVREDW